MVQLLFYLDTLLAVTQDCDVKRKRGTRTSFYPCIFACDVKQCVILCIYEMTSVSYVRFRGCLVLECSCQDVSDGGPGLSPMELLSNATDVLTGSNIDNTKQAYLEEGIGVVPADLRRAATSRCFSLCCPLS